MSRSLTAMIAASAIVLPSLSQFATAATPSSKAGKSSQSLSNKKASSTKTFSSSSQAASSNDQSDMANCDLNNDGLVDVSDVIVVINNYGNSCNTADCNGDANRDQLVDMADVLFVLANYGTVTTVPAPATLLSGVRACLQSKFSGNVAGLEALGVKNDCWMVHGYAVDAPHNCTDEEFFNASVSDIEYRFGRYLSKKTDLMSNYDGMVIIDIERPYHPQQLGKFIDPNSKDYNPEKFEAIVDGYKRRIAVVRDMLPNCKLGIYGFPTPHSHGKLDSNAEQQRIFGYEMAAARGLLDQIDVICPVIYQRFGSTDNNYDRIASYTVNGIEVGRSLRRTDGSTFEIQPLVSFKIYNGASAHDKELITIADLADQIEVIREQGVEEFMFWHGKDDLDGSTTVTERLGELLNELEYRSENVMVADGS